MRHPMRWFRRDITGDVHRCTADLSRAALRRLDRGHSVDDVRAWVAGRSVSDRYGLLAPVAVLTVLATPTPSACDLPRVVIHQHQHPDLLDALACADCATLGETADAFGALRRGDFTAADLEDVALGFTDTGSASPRLLAGTAFALVGSLAVWTAAAPSASFDGRGLLALFVAAALVLATRRQRGAVR